MTTVEFSTQMNRLTGQFGRQAYGEERAKLIFREVQDFGAAWLGHLVDEMVGSSRMPPLLPEFREAAARERERLWSMKKQEHAQGAKEFWSNLPTEELAVVFGGIRKRVTGAMGDEEYGGFHTMLENLGNGS